MPGLGRGLGLAVGLVVVTGLTDFIFTSTVVVLVLEWSVAWPDLVDLSPCFLGVPTPGPACSLRSVGGSEGVRE